MKASRRRLIGAAAVFGALGFPAIAGAADDVVTMRLNEPDAADSLLGLTALHFAAQVARRTQGRVKIEVYPNGQLVKQQETVASLLSGVVDFAMIGQSFLVSLLPALQIFDLPFLCKDTATGYRILDGPIAADLYAQLETKGIVGLGIGIAGFKELETTGRAVAVPADAKGLRVRIQAGVVPAATYQALGAIPVTIDLSEILVALEQHTIDALDFTIDSFVTFKAFTVAKHCSMTNQFFSPTPLIGSRQRIEGLPLAFQKILREEGKAANQFWRGLRAKQAQEQVAFLKQNGVTFNEIDYPAFRKAVTPIYASVQTKVGADLFERITRAANSS